MLLLFREARTVYRSEAAPATDAGRGAFIVLEGIDGSGTTTQLGRIAAAIRAAGHEVVETREPTDGPVGRQLRAALRGEVTYSEDEMARLFAADRLDHLAVEIDPALARGAVVISDRYVGSSLVYQSQFCAPAVVRALNARARRADLTLVLVVPPDVAERRRAARGGPAERYDDGALQARLARAYEALPKLLPGERVVLVDGAASAEAVTTAALAEVARLVEGRTGEPEAEVDAGARERSLAEADAWLTSLLR